jgi:probable DNA metabolism protein
MFHLTTHRDLARWRSLARDLLGADVPPDTVLWSDDPDEGTLLLGSTEAPPARSGVVDRFSVPKSFLEIAGTVSCHRDPDRWNLLYRTLWRLLHGERALLDRLTDDDTHRLNAMAQAVRRDRHKMTAFVRFRAVPPRADTIGPDNADQNAGPAAEQFVAWHRPDHYIVRLTAPFFARRFAALTWAILTPDDSVAWDGRELTFGPGVPASEAPTGDDLEALWRTYYANIFNPARVKVRAMKKEMPVRHWATLPETQLIPDLFHDAPKRVAEMVRKARQAAKPAGQVPARPALFAAPAGDATSRDLQGAGSDLAESASGGDLTLFPTTGPAAPDPAPSGSRLVGDPLVGVPAGTPVAWGARPFIPASNALPVLAAASKACRGCGLCDIGTQTVFGEGPATADVVFVGEQPGDQEDRAGRPFVGPAGQVFDDALRQVGIDRTECYVTNTVKHFKWEPRGTRRLHAKPNAREVTACRPWLEEELRLVRPKVLVCLGSTAAQALVGRDFRVTERRGRPFETEWSPWTVATIHPSALLRIPDPALREQSHRQFVDDLALVAGRMREVRAR